MRIIGLTGQPSSGKDTAADFFIKRGFVHISTSDLIREEMKKLGLPLDRPHVGDFATEQRKVRGPAYLAEEAAALVKGDSIISGLRNTKEVLYLRERFGADFMLVATTASLRTRYERAHARNRAGDNITFEQFRAQEEFEQANPVSQEVNAVVAMADHIVPNEGTKEEFIGKLEALAKGL